MEAKKNNFTIGKRQLPKIKNRLANSILQIACCLLPISSYAQYTEIFDFPSSYSYCSIGPLISDGTYFYGMTKTNGDTNTCHPGGCGTIFKVKSDGTEYAVLFNFDGINGRMPSGSLISIGNFLYGMTPKGGTHNNGVVFKIKQDGTSFSKLYDFTNTNGKEPVGSLIYDGTFLYGTTNYGSTGMGTIFKIKPDGTGDTTLCAFQSPGINGYYPDGDLIFDGTFLYGMASNGGSGPCSNGCGVIFRIKPDGTGDTVMLNFTGANGSFPQNNHLISMGAFFYGMTMDGGSNNYGTIFKIKRDGTGYSKLFDFDPSGGNGLNGSFPRASLVSDGTFLYGTTALGGANGRGVLFKIKPDGTMFTKLIDFGLYPTYGYPSGPLLCDGNFIYGISTGTSGDGVPAIFKYALTTGITENTLETDFTIYPNPSNGIFTIEAKENNCFLIITNILGETIYQSEIANQKSSIDLSRQPKGIYSIRLMQNNKISGAEKRLIID